jgi:hypothetical protein
MANRFKQPVLVSEDDSGASGASLVTFLLWTVSRSDVVMSGFT